MLITWETALEVTITEGEFVIDVPEEQTPPFGPVTAGSLRVRGRILQASTSPSDFFHEISDLILHLVHTTLQHTTTLRTHNVAAHTTLRHTPRCGTHQTRGWHTSIDIDNSNAVEEFRNGCALFDEGRGLCTASQGPLLTPTQTQRVLYCDMGHFPVSIGTLLNRFTSI